MEWNDTHEEELILIQKYSYELYSKYHDMYLEYSKKSDKYKIPIIILTSFVGIINLSNASYIPQKFYIYVSIMTGLISIICTIIASIEQLKKVNEILNKSLNSYLNFKLLSDEISHLIRTPQKERDKHGLETVKYYFQRFQSYYIESPILNELSKNFFNIIPNNTKTTIKQYINNDFNIDEKEPILFNL